MTDDNQPTNVNPAAADETAEDLYNRWRQGWVIPVEMLLDRAEELSQRQLVEVLLADQHERHDDGKPIRVEEYFARYPALRHNPEGSVDLIYGEYLLAAADGPVDRHAYLERFGDFRKELQMQFELDSALNIGGVGQTTNATGDESFDDTHLGWNADSQTMAGSAVTAASDKRFGRYEVVRKIGEGGMGEVFEAFDPAVSRAVAIKVPKPALFQRDGRDAVRRFMREVRAAGGVQHRNVCEIYDVGEQGKLPFVVMKFVDGVALDQWLRDNHGIAEDVEYAVDLVCQVAEGLGEAHREGVIHRDVKPGNILIDSDGLPKLTDFGLAWFEADRHAASNNEGVPGTWKYMAPESRLGKADLVGPWSDVYSLGVVLWQSLFGELPPEPMPEEAASINAAHDASTKPGNVTADRSDRFSAKLADSHQDPQRPDVDEDLRTILHRALEPIAEQRYREANAFARALRRWLDDRGSPSGTAPESEPTKSDTTETDLPGYLALLWMLLMKPISLHVRLRRCGIDEPEQAAWRMWSEAGDSQAIRRKYIQRMAFVLLTAAPVAIIVISNAAVVIQQLLGGTVDSGRGLLATAVLATTGIFFSLIFGAFRGPAWGVSWGLSWGAGSAMFSGSVIPLLSVFGVTGDLVSAIRDGVLVGLVLGFSGGLCRTIGGSVASGKPVNVTDSVALGAIFAIGFGAIFGFVAQWIQWTFGGMQLSSSASIAAGLGAGCTFACAGLLTAFRLPMYPFEAAWQMLLFVIRRVFGYETLAFSPVMHHELCYLPYPTLAWHIRATEETDFELANAALQACRNSTGQRRLAKKLQANLLAEKIASLVRQRRFDETAHVLSSIATTSNLVGLDELARTAREASAIGMRDERQREAMLHEAALQLDRLERQLEKQTTPLAAALLTTLPVWRTTLGELRSVPQM